MMDASLPVQDWIKITATPMNIAQIHKILANQVTYILDQIKRTANNNSGANVIMARN